MEDGSTVPSSSSSSSYSPSTSSSMINHPGSTGTTSPHPRRDHVLEEYRRALNNQLLGLLSKLSDPESVCNDPDSTPAAFPGPRPGPKHSDKHAERFFVTPHSESQSRMKRPPETVCDARGFANERLQRTRGLSPKYGFDLNEIAPEHQDATREIESRCEQVELALDALLDAIDTLDADLKKSVHADGIPGAVLEYLLARTKQELKKKEASGDGREEAGPDPSDFQGVGAQFGSSSNPQESMALSI